MKKTCEHLYQTMREDLEHCKRKHLPPVTEIECCYQIAAKYWGVLRQKAAKYEFGSKEDEIYFFKVCKPLFVSEIIFYELLYHLELFKPDTKENRRNLFLREKNRFAKLAWSNPEFFDYYKGGHTCKDEIYFVRSQDMTDDPNLAPYDYNNKTLTSHDYLVAQIMALERYDKYLDQKLKELNCKN